VENSTISSSGNFGSNPSSSPLTARSGQPGAPILQQTQQKAGEVINQARGQVPEQLESQKQRATGALSGLAQALRQTGQQLQQDQAPFGQYAESAADAVERFSGYLSERDIPQMIGSVESFARSRPTMFLGGAFALGMLAARFLKSSAAGDGPGDGLSGNGAGSHPSSIPWSPPTRTLDLVDTNRGAGGASGMGATGSEFSATTSIGDSSFTGDADEADEIASSSELAGTSNTSEARG